MIAAIFVITIGIGMISFGVLTLIIFINTLENDRVKRPLPFEFWFFDVDLEQTPIYEISFAFGCMCVASHVFMYLCKIFFLT